MGFPWPMGGGAFSGRDRYEETKRATNALAGEGAWPEDPDSVFRRTLDAMGMLKAKVSLCVDRLANNIFPYGAQRWEMLRPWEVSLRIAADQGAISEERRARCEEVYADRGARTGIAEAQKIAEIIGGIVGVNVFYRFNTAAALDLAGFSRVGIYRIAIEVPVDYILSPGTWTPLYERVLRWVPAHVEVSVVRDVLRGFLCDDDLSRCDRDVLDYTV